MFLHLLFEACSTYQQERERGREGERERERERETTVPVENTVNVSK